MNKQKLTILTLSLAIAMLVSGCAARQTKKNQTPVNNPTQNQVATSSDVVASSSDAIDTSDWKTYSNELLESEFKYPSEWKVTHETKNTLNQVWLGDNNQSMRVNIGEINCDFYSRYRDAIGTISVDAGGCNFELRKIVALNNNHCFSISMNCIDCNITDEECMNIWNNINDSKKERGNDNESAPLDESLAPSSSKKSLEILKNIASSFKKL